MQFINALKVARPYPYYPIFSIVFKDEQIGIFISDMLRWEGKGEDKDGYIWKTYEELLSETGLNRKKVQRISKILTKMGVLDVVRKKPVKSASEASVMHYRINWNILNTILESHEIINSYKNQADNFLICKQVSNLDSSLIISQVSNLDSRGGQVSKLDTSTIYTSKTLKDISFFSFLDENEKTKLPFHSQEFKDAFLYYLEKIVQSKYKVNETFISTRFNKLRKYKEEFAILLIEEASEKPWLRIEFDSTPEKYQKWLMENGKAFEKNRVLQNKINKHKLNIENALSEEVINKAILYTIKDDLVLDYNEAIRLTDEKAKQQIMELGLSLTKKINGE